MGEYPISDVNKKLNEIIREVEAADKRVRILWMSSLGLAIMQYLNSEELTGDFHGLHESYETHIVKAQVMLRDLSAALEEQQAP